MAVLDRFLEYVGYDTMSKSGKDEYPSTPGQRVLLDLLRDQLIRMGLTDVRQDPRYGYVYASIPSNCKERTIPSIGFIAHVDTSEAMSGKNVKPKIIENYDGGDIVLNRKKEIITKIEDFPEMADLKGKTVVVTDGTTLLGADDKAGVAAIMELAAYYAEHPREEHGTICIAFTADEETGRGVDFFDVQGFGAHYAYTVDGGRAGDLSGETFNAADAKVTVHGRSVHPGEGYGKLKNAMQILMEFHALLPEHDRPESTRLREGFYHITRMSGDVETATAEYIIRDHDTAAFADRKLFVLKAAGTINSKYGEGTISVETEDQYYNMKPHLDKHPDVLRKAIIAMAKAGMMPKVEPIRGGTDGARLTFMGLPCPNLCTGGGNFHGKHEYLCVEELEETVEMLKHIVREWAVQE